MRHLLPVGSAVLMALVLGCGGTTSPTSPSESTTASTPSNPGTYPVVAGCEVSASTPGTPELSDPKSPYFDYVGVATSGDGITASGFQEVLAHASAPDGTQLPDGTIGVYYGNGETGGIWMGRLSGTTLTPVSAITVNGVLRPMFIADVNVMLVNGTVRMFYMNGEGGSHRICVAESTDGLNFTIVSLALRVGHTEGAPSVAQLPDGSWLLAYARNPTPGVAFARSSDGLTFTALGTVDYGGGSSPELATTAAGARLYVCAAGKIDSYTTADAGASWSYEGAVINRSAFTRTTSCDPSYVPAAGVFLFKTTDA